MNIAFHSNQLGERGTEVAMYDYALYNETLLHNKSFIIAPNLPNMMAYYKFKEKFPVFLYKNFSEVESFVEKNNIEFVYFIKSGENDGKIVTNAKNLIHVVFQNLQLHGNKYVFISKWLSKKVTGLADNYVPHIVSLPKNVSNYRKYLGIPEAAIVYGRYGGAGDFDNLDAQRAVIDIAKEYPNRYFLFMNTNKFLNSEYYSNIFFFNGSVDLHIKSAFINTCDFMIYGRNRGETFGLAIAEFLNQGKPVIANYGNLDLAHHDMLQDKNKIYNSYDECYEYLKTCNDWKDNTFDYSSLTSKYTPEKVMNKFKTKFLL